MAQPVQGNGPTGQVISAEVRRRLSPIAFVSNTLQTSDLPRDTVLKRIAFYVQGSTSAAYAAGSPIADSQGCASRLCPRLDLVVDGQRTVKSIDIWMQQKLNGLMYGALPTRASATSAGAPTTRIASTEVLSGAPFTWPATTQYILFNEAFIMEFENNAYDSMDRSATLLQLKGASSAELRFNFADIANLQRFETSPVAIAYTVTDVSFVANLIEAQEIPADFQGLDFKETIRRASFSAEVRDQLVDLPRGNALMGLAFGVRNGDANKTPSDLPIQDLSLILNGQRTLQRTKFIELQNDNRCRFGMVSSRVSSRHSLEGFAFMNLLKNGMLSSAVNTTQSAGVDAVSLAVTTAPSSGTDAATYTNPVELTIWSQELAAVPGRR